MSVLDNPRVTRTGADGYTVSSAIGPIAVLPNDVLGWGLYWGETMELVPAGPDGSGFAIGFGSAEEAVQAALGAKAS